ncbi:MAG TPA: hypothetical protein VFJ85_12270 [Acidimicrobiales bacterium]|nr:hypothetical protein [Acidimicrobiales bacterium]
MGASLRQFPLVEPTLPAPALRKVRDAVLRHIDFDLNRRTDEDDKAPPTEWEAVVYARCDGWSPLDLVWAVTLYFQVQAAWREIETALSPEEVAELVAWGRRQAEVIPGIRPERVEPPPTPIRLRED